MKSQTLVWLISSIVGCAIAIGRIGGQPTATYLDLTVQMSIFEPPAIQAGQEKLFVLRDENTSDGVPKTGSFQREKPSIKAKSIWAFFALPFSDKSSLEST